MTRKDDSRWRAKGKSFRPQKVALWACRCMFRVRTVSSRIDDIINLDTTSKRELLVHPAGENLALKPGVKGKKCVSTISSFLSFGSSAHVLFPVLSRRHDSRIAFGRNLTDG